MLGDVWRVRKFRISERTLGVPAYRAPVDLHQLWGDARAWMVYKSYPADELLVRFHHRLVSIHSSPNGNGRHARLIADLLVMRFGCERFSRGRANLKDPAMSADGRYIAARKAVDNRDVAPPVAFALIAGALVDGAGSGRSKMIESPSGGEPVETDNRHPKAMPEIVEVGKKTLASVKRKRTGIAKRREKPSRLAH